MASSHTSWFAVRTELPARRNAVLTVLSFLLPLATWSAVSYVPWLWHPMVEVRASGATGLAEGKRYEKAVFAQANAQAVSRHVAPAEGKRANPVFLPAPDQVARGFYRMFTEAPQLRDDPWFYQSIGHSLQVIFWGFFWSCVFGVPIGLLCGTFSLFSKLIESPVDFIRYMPAPAFGALMVAVFGLSDAPKVAIIFIGTFFQMVLIIANTTRLLDRSLLEAAQTLGASHKQLVKNVILPGVMPNLYNDLRILLGWAWTYLIVAELIGEKSGVTAYIAQQSRYFNFDLVYAAILVIGLIGLTTDQLLQSFARVLFPWQHRRRSPIAAVIWAGITFVPRRAASLARVVLATRFTAEEREFDAAVS
jgi:NitT/TauT family transport system permease protein